MSTRALRTLLLGLAALVALPAGTATAAKRGAYPRITAISPMHAAVGQRMTITGKGFLPGARKTTVVLRRDGQPAVFVKADQATTTRLSFVVPDKLARFVPASGPAKFRVRILARRFGRAFTSLKASPSIGARETVAVDPAAPAPRAVGSAAATPAAATLAPAPDCDGDHTPDAQDADDDNDLLPDDVERAITTDPCLADTDGDGMTDGWEYQSARDLNADSCPTGDYPTPCASIKPYPGKRPYPNPRDASDGSTDHDGDWLPAALEFAAAQRHGITDLGNLWYSDGLQASQDDSAASGCRGMQVPAPWGGLDFYSQDRFNKDGRDGCLNDAERDEDNDLLINVEEVAGQMSGPEWWHGVYKEPLFQVAFPGTDWLTTDSDGDGIQDGLDDQDHDDFLNVEELVRGPQSDGTSTVRTGLWVNPFNPCLPSVRSRTCPPSIPLNGDVWAPYDRDNVYLQGDRWPLYGRFTRDSALLDVLGRFSDGYIDPGSDGNAATAPGSSTEWWLGPVPRSQQEKMPPPHPLPR